MQTIGVVGLGLLGRGIATCLVSHGLHVVVFDEQRELYEEVRRHIADVLPELVGRGGFPAKLLDHWPGAIRFADALNELATCDFIIESIFENAERKQELLKNLESLVAADVPLASNTSAVPISLLQSNLQHPQRVVGMHWAEPCHLTRFLEVIRGHKTDDRTLEKAVQLGKRIGKDPTIVQKDVAGFIVNRLGYAMFREAFWLVENGIADVETIDRAFSNALGVWVNVAGPFRWMDLTGLPAYAAVMKRLFPQLNCSQTVPSLMTRLVESGSTGISSGKGFYEYTPEEQAAWEARLHENVWRVNEMTRDLFFKEN
jgi:3-hydroxyacyl-CoA dehydrogenase